MSNALRQLALLLMVIPASLAAQTSGEPRFNARVRVTTMDRGAAYVGQLSSMDSASIILHQPSAKRAGMVFEGAVSSYPTASVTKLEVSHGRNRVASHIVAGGLIGLVTGAAIGGGIMYVATQCNNCTESGIGVILGVPVGGILGAFFGSRVGYDKAGDRWESIPIPGRTSR